MDFKRILPNRLDREIYFDRWKHKLHVHEIAGKRGIDLDAVKRSLARSVRTVLSACRFPEVG